MNQWEAGCESVYHFIRGNIQGPIYVPCASNWIKLISGLLHRDWDVTVTRVYRKANICADGLAVGWVLMKVTG